MDDFYLTLPSNVSSQFFENTSTNFRTKLAKRITVTDDYEVGLAEISYTLRFFNVTEDEIIVLRYNEIEKEKEITKYVTKEYITKLKAGFYKIDELLEYLNTSFEIEDSQADPILEINEEEPDKIRFYYGLKKITIRNPYQNLKQIQYVSVELSRNLSNLLGFDKSQMDQYSNYLLKEEYAVAEKETEKLKDYIDAILPYDMKAGINALFIYCDIIKPHLVGDSQLQLLKYVEIPNRLKYGDQVHLKYSNIQYFDIQTKEFDSVEISIRDDAGEKIYFSNSKNVVVLHFRKR